MFKQEQEARREARNKRADEEGADVVEVSSPTHGTSGSDAVPVNPAL